MRNTSPPLKNISSSCRPSKSQWTLSYSKDVYYVDLCVKPQDGIIRTDIHTKFSHVCLPSFSDHPSATFKGFIYDLGTRGNWNENATLHSAVNEYARYFHCSDWNLQRAKEHKRRKK